MGTKCFVPLTDIRTQKMVYICCRDSTFGPISPIYLFFVIPVTSSVQKITDGVQKITDNSYAKGGPHFPIAHMLCSESKASKIVDLRILLYQHFLDAEHF